ncbi:V-type ATP synthase subunit I, partial [[Clostridium] scindens]
KQDYYILCGWMADDDVEMFLEETRYDDKIFVVVEDDHSTYFGEPPTKLKNPKIFKPFEMFIRMYGLPSHNEMDPTIIVGLTYSLIFGIMFGDVGQGLLLFIGGSLIYHFRKAPLAGIIATAGIFSTIFGFMFGSIFGFEDIIQPLWLRPIDHMTTLPFIGKLNTVFIVSVAFGMVIILAAMILHIVNAIRFHDLENIWFDANGLAGFVFYLSVVITIVLFMTGHKTPGAVFMAVMFGIPLLLILFKEPITRKIQKRADAMEESAGMFLIQGFFELFETLLSYFSNTLSFVRIGAFAVSHAAIMEVVLILAGAENGSPNWVIIVLGNLFVCGFEGLIVGIQVLRLEYYEMFSRFYKGSGRAFDPYTNKSNKTKKK